MTLPTPSQTSSMRTANSPITSVAKSEKGIQQASAPYCTPTQTMKRPTTPGKNTMALSSYLKSLAMKRGIVKTFNRSTTEA